LPSPVEAEVLRIRQLLERNEHAAALAAAEALAVTVPHNRDVMYMMAVAQRFLGQVDAALATLARLERFHPQFSRLYQERGYCHVARREAAPAIDAFLRAVNLNPALPASWKMLQSLFRMTGQPANAANADSNGSLSGRKSPASNARRNIPAVPSARSARKT